MSIAAKEPHVRAAEEAPSNASPDEIRTDEEGDESDENEECHV